MEIFKINVTHYISEISIIAWYGSTLNRNESTAYIKIVIYYSDKHERISVVDLSEEVLEISCFSTF